MEGGENILDVIEHDESSIDFEDVEMLDAEEGEIVDGKNSQIDLGEANKENGVVSTEPLGKRRKRRNNKKKNKRRKGVARSDVDVTDINRFVLNICRQLKEKKSYLVYSAVGCLGASAVSELVKEVEAVLACGGQKTADGTRMRTGGGILWNILKTRDPNAYKEIMKRGREFEKQFKPPNPVVNKNASHSVPPVVPLKFSSESNGSEVALQDQPGQSSSEVKRVPIQHRIRVPVSYDDLPGAGEPDSHET